MTIEMQYNPVYDPDTNSTIYRLPNLGEPGEAVIPNSDDDGYSVYLDEDLTDEDAMEKAHHAIDEHVRKNHHGMDADVQQLEAEAHHLVDAAEPEAVTQVEPKKPALKKKNRYRLLRPEEYEKIGIDPRYADILRLTVIDAPKISKKKYKEFCKEMKNDDILKKKTH